jgi:hypothetical protein
MLSHTYLSLFKLRELELKMQKEVQDTKLEVTTSDLISATISSHSSHSSHSSQVGKCIAPMVAAMASDVSTAAEANTDDADITELDISSELSSKCSSSSSACPSTVTGPAVTLSEAEVSGSKSRHCETAIDDYFDLGRGVRVKNEMTEDELDDYEQVQSMVLITFTNATFNIAARHWYLPINPLMTHATHITRCARAHACFCFMCVASETYPQC